jgi:hypothetical protein
MTYLPDPWLTPTVSIETGGAILGMGTTASYESAKAGTLPTVAAGSVRRRVPTAALYDLLGLPLPASPYVAARTVGA